MMKRKNMGTSFIKEKNNYHWVVCALGLIILFFCVGLSSTSISVIYPYIQAAGGYSNEQISRLVSIRSAVSTITLLFADTYISLLKPRKEAGLGLLLLALSYYCYGLGQKYIFCCLAAVLGGLSYALAGMVFVSYVISKWFTSKRAFAISICSAGSGVSSMVFAPSMTFLMEHYSLKTSFSIISIITVCCAFIVCIFLRNDPREIGLSPYVAPNEINVNSLKNHSDCDKSKLTAAIIAYVGIGFATSAFTSFIATFYKSVGINPYTVSLTVSMHGIMLIFGKLLHGVVTDKYTGKVSFKIFFALYFAGNVVACLVTGRTVFTAFLATALHGLGGPITTVGLTATARDLSSEEHLVKRMKLIQSAFAIGGIISGMVSGRIADKFGSYLYCWYIVVALLAVSFALMSYAYKRPKKLPARP